MNMHVASDSIVAEEPLVTARLPGEPEEAEEIEASEPEKPEAQQPPRRARRVNRKILLAGVAVGALVAGVGFLISPYNHAVPLPAPVRAAASLVWNRPPLLAPSAELAQVTLPPPSGPAVRTPYVGQPPSQQVNEVVALRAGAPASTQSSGRPAEVSPPPAPPSPRAGRPATPPKPASAPAASGATAVGIDEPPPGFVPHEPGSSPAGEASVPPGANPPPAVMGTAPGAASAPPRAPDISATVPPTASSGAAAASDGGDGASASAAPSPASPAPTAAPPSVSTGDITQQIMTRVTASLELKPPSFAAPALPESAPAGHQEAVPAQPAAAAPPAAPSAAPAASPAPSASSVPPSDPVQIAAALRPSLMTPQDQVQVLELVTQMATMVRDLKKESAQMRADFARSQADEAARVSDWERRLALAEARGAMLAADAAGSAPFVVTAPGAVSGKPDTAPPETVRVSTTSPPTTAVVPADDAGKKYHLQAASPGLAMLAEIDRGGGEGAQIQVAVGDTVPGYGRVKAVTQRGTAWVVETEHGTIE